LRLTGKRGVDHVVEVGGAGTLARSIRATAADGYVHLIGVLTGGEMDPAGIMRGGVNVRGIRVGSRATFEEMNRAIALHSLRPVIDRVFPFAEARDAYRHLEGATHFGKVVIGFD
jgi:NADPH:quinone reductase-like Zn-dependent oxidoreductase